MKTILITAIGSFSAASVIACYKNLGFRVVGCDIYPEEWVASSLDVDAFYRAPYATDQAAYLAFMEMVCRREQVSFLIPLTDVEVDVLNGFRSTAERLGVTLCMSSEEAILRCRNKRVLEEYLSELGICLTIPGEVLSEADPGNLRYPAVVKPFMGRSSQGLRYVEDSEELKAVKTQLGSQGASYLVQPKISGYVVTVDVVRQASLEGSRTVCLPRKEYLRTPNGAGTSVYVFRDEQLEGQCQKIAEALDVRGCVNFEFIEKTTETGPEWYFLECNPRFSGGVAFSILGGYDMAKAHLDCFLGKLPETMGYIPGQYLVKRYTEYCMKVEE